MTTVKAALRKAHGAGIGGRLITARVDASGISVRESYAFSQTAVHGTREAPQSEEPAAAPIRTVTAGELMQRALGGV